MTKAHSMPDDNGGLCECCNKPETEYQQHQAYPIMLGGGLGMGTMWLCPKCLQEHKLRDENKTAKSWRLTMIEPLARDPGLAKLMAKIREDDVPCKICGEITNSLAGDPSKWPVRVYIPWIPCEPGKLWTYHQECHWKEMQKVVKLVQAAEAFMEDLGLTNLLLKALKPFKDLT